MTTMILPRLQINGLTAVLWVGVNVIGFGLAGAMFHNFPLAFAFQFPPPLFDLRSFDVNAAIFGALLPGGLPGVVIGFCQWLILRRHIRVSRWWILAAVAGISVCHFLSDGFPSARDLTLAVLAGGLVMGVGQWFLLRQQMPTAKWWLVVTFVSWYLGWVISMWWLRSEGLIYQPWTPNLGAQQHGAQGVILGALYSLLTGGLLVWFLPAKASK